MNLYEKQKNESFINIYQLNYTSLNHLVHILRGGPIRQPPLYTPSVINTNSRIPILSPGLSSAQ